MRLRPRKGLRLSGARHERTAPLLQRMSLILRKSILSTAMVVLPLTYAQGAWGQGAATATPADSVETWTYRISPTYKAEIKGNVNQVEIGSEFRNMLETQGGMRLVSGLSLDKVDFRLREGGSQLKKLNNSVMKSFREGLIGTISQVDSRSLTRVVQPGGVLQNLVSGTKSVSAGVAYATIEPSRFRWDGRLNADVSDSERSFKRDKSSGGSAGGGVVYELVEDRLVVRARGFLREEDTTSESIFERYDGLGVSQDSVGASASVYFGDSVRVDFDYTDFNSDETLADQKRGSAGGQIVGAENLFRERKLTDSRVMSFGLDTWVLSGLNVKVSAQHAENSTQYNVASTLSSRNVSDVLSGSLNYKLFTGTTVGMKLSNGETLKDIANGGTRSYDEKRKSASLSLRHQFSRTFSTEFSASSNLTQSFFVRYDENPRDKDQLDNSITARVVSSPFSKLQTSFGVTVLQSEIVNIDASVSDQNQLRTKYDLQPKLTYTLNDRVNVEQNYGLAIESTEMTYKTDENVLDRNITFSNKVNARLTEKLRGSFYYALHLHDRGSYLPEFEGGERFLRIDRKDRNDKTEINVDYQITDHIRLTATHEYSVKSDRTVATDSERVTKLGGIEGGVVGSFGWGQGRTLKFTLVKANRFSPFSGDKQDDYWIMNASFEYGF